MNKVIVTNKGKRSRDRLGSRFIPSQEKELEVSNRELLTLKAVKDFEVKVISETDDTETSNEEIPDEESYHDNDIESDINNDSETEYIETSEDEDEDYLDTTEPEGIQDVQSTINNSNIHQIMDMVINGEIDIDEAIAYEVVGKNRATLIDQLEAKKQGD